MKLPFRNPALLASAFLAATALAATADVLERVVAKVNGEIVTLTEFQARQVAAAQAARIPPERMEAFLRENNARILQEAVDDLLVVQRAAELGFQLRPEYINQYINQVIDDIKKENGLENDEQMAAQLRREGLTLADLKRNIERSILRNQVLGREVQQKIAIADDVLRAAYETRKAAEFSQPARLHLHEIVVAGDGAGERAAALVARARAGEDFAALAREHSSAASRAAGGDLGSFEHGDLHPDVERVAFALGAGDVSDPFASGDGFRILRVSEATAATVSPFEEVKPKLQQELQQQRFAAAYDTFIQKLRDKALLDVRVREVPLDVALPAASAPALTAPTTTVSPAAERSFAVPEIAGVTTTPQAKAEKVAPPAREVAAPTAVPSPTPSPTPEPR